MTKWSDYYKRKNNVSIKHYASYAVLTFVMTWTFDYQGQIVEYLYLSNGRPIDVKRNESKSIGWVKNVTLNFDHIHDHGISWSNFEIASQELESQLI